MQKPGYKTTEFWLSVVAMLVGVLLSSGAFEPGGVVMQGLGVAASVLGALGYTVSRSLVKGQEEKTKQAREVAKLGGPSKATRGKK